MAKNQHITKKASTKGRCFTFVQYNHITHFCDCKGYDWVSLGIYGYDWVSLSQASSALISMTNSITRDQYTNCNVFLCSRLILLGSYRYRLLCASSPTHKTCAHCMLSLLGIARKRRCHRLLCTHREEATLLFL